MGAGWRELICSVKDTLLCVGLAPLLLDSLNPASVGLSYLS